MVIYFLRSGKLPWQGIDAKNWDDRCLKITNLKKQTKTEALCEGHPSEFADYLEYCRGLKFSERPDYGKLRGALKDLMFRERLQSDNVFDWMPPPPVSIVEERRQSLSLQAEEAGLGLAMTAA